MAHWQKNTCIQFVERTNNQSKDYLKIINSKGWVPQLQPSQPSFVPSLELLTVHTVAHCSHHRCLTTLIYIRALCPVSILSTPALTPFLQLLFMGW